jgi:uncharacterized RDD family membrane protein YckC
MYCTRCGATNLDAARFCAGCGAPLDPAASSPPAIPYASASATPIRYAGFWRRFVAMIVDSLVFSPLVVIFVVSSGLLGIILHPGGDLEGLAGALFGVGIFALIIALLVGNWLYHTWMESSRYEATLGKMALGIVVTDLNGRRISFARANGRFFGKWISSMIMNIGFLMAAFTEKKQALHDMLASTLVVLK